MHYYILCNSQYRLIFICFAVIIISVEWFDNWHFSYFLSLLDSIFTFIMHRVKCNRKIKILINNFTTSHEFLHLTYKQTSISFFLSPYWVSRFLNSLSLSSISSFLSQIWSDNSYYVYFFEFIFVLPIISSHMHTITWLIDTFSSTILLT